MSAAPVSANVELTVTMSDGSVEELVLHEVDLTYVTAGLTCRFMSDIRTDGVVSEVKPSGAPVPGVVLAIRGKLVPQDGALYTQTRTPPETSP